MNHHALSPFIWSVADLLRGDYKQSDYGKVNRHFYVFEPPRSLHAIDEDLKVVTGRILELIGGLAE